MHQIAQDLPFWNDDYYPSYDNPARALCLYLINEGSFMIILRFASALIVHHPNHTLPHFRFQGAYLQWTLMWSHWVQRYIDKIIIFKKNLSRLVSNNFLSYPLFLLSLNICKKISLVPLKNYSIILVFIPTSRMRLHFLICHNSL